ncbi:electron transfer flavoprotein subunit beta/FixA family protein (plasmid) [Salinigranum rubrum]|uniref:Electron transfer flavoprotein subunit beta/FixA family protein n=1 Tax=Salinigranum rubrum TaxID=755307 RepID=A0A2I8VTZ4_9EURY|nr:electron transfer flavoprotein subunit beta/FixA family protein [Salinigranum rubrum]AUV84659.1 electron transfer flavoprotein subunit beta/FixA family protein [Salinigranum rubrum]
MKILVTVKESAVVADDFEIDGTSIAEKDLTYSINEWDEYALEAAVRSREDGLADEVITVTIGPERSEETIRTALAKGADRSIRVWDDTLKTQDLLDVGSKTAILAAVVAQESPGLVLTGVQAHDDGFGATGVSLADAIGFDWAAVVTSLDIDAEDETAEVRRELEGGLEERVRVPLPAVFSVQTGINEPRYASLRGIRQAQRKPVSIQSLDDLGVDHELAESTITLSGLYEPESGTDTEYFEGDAESQAKRLADVLADRGIVQP